MTPIKIGIADDHLLVINGLQTMLEKIGHIEIMFTSVDGEQLLDKLKHNSPDVLLLDIQMPGMNGMDLCRVITKDNSQIRIIALTNFDESHYVKNMLRNGAAG